MKKNTTFVLQSFSLFLVTVVGASLASADTMPPPAPVYRSQPTQRVETKVVEDTYYAAELFGANEWSFDVFGSFAFEAQDGLYNDGFGGGAGVNYFFNRFVGIGFEGYSWDAAGPIGAIGGNVIVRYPFDAWRIAPYAIGGVGCNFGGDDDEEQVNGGGGLGIEYRVTENWGIFSDARYIATEQTNDYGIARTGVRFTF